MSDILQSDDIKWDHHDFHQTPLATGIILPGNDNETQMALMSWLLFMSGSYTLNHLRKFTGRFIQKIHGLTIVTEAGAMKRFVGYFFRARELSSHPLYRNVILYDLDDASQESRFLAYCQDLLAGEYKDDVELTRKMPVEQSMSSSLQINIGGDIKETFRTPAHQLIYCMHLISRYGLVVKPFARNKHNSTYFSLCVGTPMGQEVAHVRYNEKNKTFDDVESNDTNVTPLLLACYVTNTLGMHYEGPLPDPDTTPFVLPAKQKHKLHLKFSMTYEPNLAGHNIENPHSIHIYPTQGFFVGSNYCVISLDPTLDSETDSQLVYFDNTFSVSTPFIPHGSALNFDVYATYVNDSNQSCVNQAGFVSIPFSEFLPLGASPTTITRVLTVPVSGQDSNKGVIKLTVEDCNMGLKVPSHSHTTSSLKEKQHLIASYIDDNIEFYNGHPPSINAIDRVTVFKFQTRTLQIPGCLFDVFSIPRTREDYFCNALLLAYHRRLVLEHPQSTPPFDAAQLRTAWISNASRQEKIYTVMDMVTMFVNYCTYQRDQVDHNVSTKKWRKDKVENLDSFDDIMPRINGDCEDFSMEILREIMTLKYNNSGYTDELLVKHVIPILNEFIFVSGLAGVTSFAINNNASSSCASIGGHECVYAIPNYIFFKALSRNLNNNLVLQHAYSAEERSAGADRKEQIYILEGTGNLFPEPRARSPRWNMMAQEVVDCDIDDALTQVYTDYVFYDPSKDDNFYKMIITLLTPEFYFRCGIPSFEFLVVKDVSAMFGSKSYERGVSFVELLHIDNNQHISIVACPEIPATVLQYSLAAHENDLPPSPLFKPFPLKHLIDLVAPLKYDAPSSSSEEGPRTAYSFQIRFADMTQSIIDELLSIARKTNYSLRCDPEFIHRSIIDPNLICGGYNISFF